MSASEDIRTELRDGGGIKADIHGGNGNIGQQGQMPSGAGDLTSGIKAPHQQQPGGGKPVEVRISHK